MREIISISVDKETKKRLQQLAKLTGRNKSEIITRAIRKYVFSQEFRLHRKALIPYAESKGYYLDEEIFDNS